MNIDQAIFGRRTIHKYTEAPVPTAVMDSIVHAAHQAPNHKLTWPWRFTMVGRKTREQLLPIAYRLKNAAEPPMQARIRSKLMNPGGLIVVTVKRSDDAHRQQEDYAASCCAIQNLMLSAYALGFGTKWSTGALTKHPDVCACLGIDLNLEDVVGFIWVGVPAAVPTIQRPDIEVHVRQLP
ncbi:MAG: nitroreductase [Myxococcota bacterium]|nr:nitroreductase [Myxococcota bacterium]